MVLLLTSPSQFYLHITSIKKKKKNLLPCHRFNSEQVADHEAALQTQAVRLRRDDHHTDTHNHTHPEAPICLATRTHSHAPLRCSFTLEVSHSSSHSYLHFHSKFSPPYPSSGCCPVLREPFSLLFLRPFIRLHAPFPLLPPPH